MSTNAPRNGLLNLAAHEVLDDHMNICPSSGRKIEIRLTEAWWTSLSLDLCSVPEKGSEKSSSTLARKTLDWATDPVHGAKSP